jgi:hypothetical protein
MNRSFISIVMGVALAAPITLPDASAAIIARVTPPAQSVSTASVLVFASDTPTSVNPQGALLTPVVNGRAKEFFINNSGSLTPTRFSVTVTLPAGDTVSSFKRCDLDVYFSGRGTCTSGTVTTVSMTTGVAFTTIVSLPPGSFISFQIIQTKNANITISTSVSSAFLGGSVSNS